MKMFAAILSCAFICGCGQQIPDKPTEMRVVSLAPSLTEIICAIGASDTLVGRTSACDYPLETIKDIPEIGGFGNPSLEMLIAAKPTLILEAALKEERVGQKIDELGLTRKRIACSRLDDIPKAIITVGELLQKQDQANKLAAQLNKELAELRNSVPTSSKPTVFVEIWSTPLMTAGRDSFVSEVIELAGGKNIGDEINKDFFRISSEWVISKNPDIILFMAEPHGSKSSNKILTRPGWSKISAVQNNRIYDNFNLNTVTRSGPRVAEGIKRVRDYINEN